MSVPFFTFHPLSEEAPISLTDPLNGSKEEYDIESCYEILNNFQKEIPAFMPKDASMAEHWWNRKWQVSLDYHLSSQAKKENLSKETIPKLLCKVDIYLLPEDVQKEYSFIHALMERKTHRKFLDSPMTLKTFSALLQSLKDEISPGIWSYYLAVFNVKDVPEGLYFYCPIQHGITLIKRGSFREKLVGLLCGMSASLTASFVLILSIDLETAQYTLPYERGLREIYINSGRKAQKLLLKGIQFHVGTLPSPAVRDSPMCEFLGINPVVCIPLYTLTMGIIPEKNRRILGRAIDFSRRDTLLFLYS